MKTIAVASATTLAASLMYVSPVLAANIIITGCTFTPRPSTIATTETPYLNVGYSVSPDPSGNSVYYWLEAGIDGESLEWDNRDVVDENPYIGPSIAGWTPERAGKTYTISLFAVTAATGSGQKTGSALCTTTLTYASATTVKNYGKSDKTSDPNRDRKNFSPTPKK